MKIKSLPILFGLIISSHFFIPLVAQDFKLLDVNANNFPEIEAIFQANEEGGELVDIYHKTDFQILEEVRSEKVLRIVPPFKSFVPLSIVLMIDISGSMSGDRILLVKEAAINFIRRVPLEVSEVAIASFNDRVSLNSDFTQNKDQLLHAISDLETSGGTDYSRAFLSKGIGALDVVSDGRNKKVIIFLTDGLSDLSTDEVIQKANGDSVRIYSISVDLSTPDVLKDISLKTGGAYFEAIKDVNAVSAMYSSILYKIQSDMYGRLYWNANYGCNIERKGTVEYKGVSNQYHYGIPDHKLARIETNSTSLNFGQVKPGEDKTLEMNLSVVNSPLIISGISSSGNEFRLSEYPQVPYTIFPSDTVVSRIVFQPQELGLIYKKVMVSVENCPLVSVPLSGGLGEEIYLQNPVGGEVFAIGSNTLIKWAGINTGREVQVEYRMHDTLSWLPIGSSKSFDLLWSLPSDTGSTFYVKVQPEPIQKDELNLKLNLGLGNLEPMSMDIDPQDLNIVVCDKRGRVLSYGVKSGAGGLNAHGYNNKAIAYNQQGNTLSFGRDETSLHGSAGLGLARYSNARKIGNAYILHNGEEYFLPSTSRTLNDGRSLIISPITGKQDTISDTSPIRHAAMTVDGKKVLCLNKENELKIWNVEAQSFSFEEDHRGKVYRYLINPSGRTSVAIESNSKVGMLDLDNGNWLFKLDSLKWECFSKSGDYFVCRNPDSTLSFFDSYSGAPIKQLPGNVSFQSTNKGYGLVYYYSDSISFTNLLDGFQSKKLYEPSLCNFSINKNDKQIVLLRKSGKHSLLAINDFRKICDIKTDSSENYLSMFSNKSNEVLISFENQIELWSPVYETFKAAESGRFSIVRPMVKLKDSIDMGDISVHSSKEIITLSFIKNAGKVPVKINDLRVGGKDSSSFKIVSSERDIVLKSGEQKDLELRFAPKSLGFKKALIICETDLDTLQCVVIGNAVKRLALKHIDYVDFGKIRIGEQRDSLFTALINNSTDTFRVGILRNEGPDTSQLRIVNKHKDILIKPNDSLKFNLSFFGKVRGRTSTHLSLNVYGKELTTTVIGEVVAPKTYFVAGIVYNQSDSFPLEAYVSFVDLESGRELADQKTGETGRFEVWLNADRVYGLYVSSEGFLSSAKQIDLRNSRSNDTIYTDVYLAKAIKGASMALNCIFFDFGTATLQEASNTELNKLIEFMEKNLNISIEIQGHTDNVGSREYNFRLARERAKAVKQYLINKGIAANRLYTQSLGFEKPVATNDTEEGRTANRRVEVVVK